MTIETKCELKLIVGESKKKAGTKYYALVADLGYTRKYLTFNISDIAEILGEPVQNVLNFEVGEYIVA